MAATERVLIVEDELHALAGLAELVSGWGYRTETARDGIEGLEKVAEWFPGIIVTDLKMPRMDGIELVRRIKQDNRLKNLPVVIVSYKDREEDRLRGLDAGANYYLTKSSFHDKTFLHAIEDLIGEARP